MKVISLLAFIAGCLILGGFFVSCVLETARVVKLFL